MSSAERANQKLLDDACAMIDEMGGPGALIDDLEEFRKLHARMTREYPRLLQKYPNKWVAMGKDGVVAAGATRTQVLEAVDRRGIARSETVVEFMDTDPPVLIL